MNFSRILYFIASLLLFTSLGYSQAVTDKNILFTNPSDTARQIYNLAPGKDSADALTQKQVIQNELFVTATCSGNQINLTTSHPITAYEDGMSFEFIYPSCLGNYTTAFLNVNNIGALPVQLVQQHDSLKYLKGKSIRVIIYNNAAIVFPENQNNKCPSGFVQINKNYCIQYSRNAKATFWDAIKNCGNLDSHLCTPEEWITACLNHSTQLLNMPLNWEWMDSGSNHNIHAPIIGDTANCNNIYTETTASTGLPHFYRCCYRLR